MVALAIMAFAKSVWEVEYPSFDWFSFGDCIPSIVVSVWLIEGFPFAPNLSLGRHYFAHFHFKRWYDFESCMVIGFCLGFCVCNPTHLMEVLMVLWSIANCLISLCLNQLQGKLCAWGIKWRIPHVFYEESLESLLDSCGFCGGRETLSTPLP